MRKQFKGLTKEQIRERVYKVSSTLAPNVKVYPKSREVAFPTEDYQPLPAKKWDTNDGN